MNTIRNLGNGWYDFSALNQEAKYMKIHALKCNTDRKAINRAKKILGNKAAKIEIKKEG